MDQNQQQQIPLQTMPEILKGVYANNMQVAHTKEDFVLDFMNLSHIPQVMNLVAKVFTNPGHFKRMVAALNENLKRYEDQFGVITDNNSQTPSTPSTTSDKQFGFSTKN